MPSDHTQTDPAARAERWSRWGWPALVVALSLVAMRGAFSATDLFYDRDLGAYYWPLLLWFRREVFAGAVPLWDPYMAFGQSAVAEPIRQMLFLPTLPVRLLLPAVPAFNLSVALPYPAAGLGAYLFFRRHVSRQAAAFGAVAFVLSGPLLSLGNMLNNSTTAALVPWAVWAADRLGERVDARRAAALAAVFALQVAAGEPVTLACTAALVLAYAAFGPRGPAGGRGRLRFALAAGAAGLAGALLASAQLFPLLAALVESKRGTGTLGDGWSVHPLWLAETLAPWVWGDLFVPIVEWSPWVNPLNSGREPYLKSIYLGAGFLLVAALGAAAPRRRWAAFWGLVFAVALVFALGYNTPVYGLVRSAVPVLQTFRYPAKYLVFAVFALSALAAAGWDLLAERRAAGGGSRAAIPAAAGAALAAAAAAAALYAAADPAGAGAAFAWLAERVGVAAEQVPAAAALAASSAPGHGARLAAVAAAVAATLWLGGSGRPVAPLARAALFAVVAADLLAASAPLNPTVDAALLSPPAWTEALAGREADRVYVGRDERASGDDGEWVPLVVGADPSTPTWIVRTLYSVTFVNMPSGWGVRETMSRDMVRLRSAAYWAMASRFHAAGGGEKARYLARTATRFYLLPFRPEGDYRLVRPLENLDPYAVYELTSVGPRAFVAPSATVEPNVDRQTALMMSAGYDPYASVLLAAEPPPAAGEDGEAVPPAAEIVGEETNEVVVRAGVPSGGGYLVLIDTYEAGWRAEVDGRPAEIVRADGLFRAVRLAPGVHTVRFVYRPTSFYLGLAASLATGLALLALCLRGGRRRA